MYLYKSWGFRTKRTVIYNNFFYVKGLCEVCMFYTYIFVKGWYLYYTNNLKLQGSKFQIIYAQLNMINIYYFKFRPKLYIVPLRLLFYFNYLISYPDHIFLCTSYFIELFLIQISLSPSLFLCVSPLTIYPPSKAKISTNISFYWTVFFNSFFHWFFNMLFIFCFLLPELIVDLVAAAINWFYLNKFQFLNIIWFYL